MAAAPLTDQERALLAQFVASNTSNPADAPILIQYVMDRLARGRSTLAEVVAQLSPNGLDANADYGPYLDAVNRTLGPQTEALVPQGSSDSDSSSSGYESSPATTRPIFEGGNPLAALVEKFFGQPEVVKPSRVHVASLDPLPAPMPPPGNIQPRAAAPIAPPMPRPDPRPPIPAQPAVAPVRQPVAPPVAAAPQPSLSPAGPFQENVPGPNGYSSSTKDQSRLATVGNLAFEPQPVGPSTRTVQSVPTAPADLIQQTMERLASANGPFKAANTGDDLAFGPVQGVAVPSLDAGGYTGPAFDTSYPRHDDPNYASIGALPFQARLPELAPPNAIADPMQRTAPTPATMSPELRRAVSVATAGVNLSPEDRELLVRAVATEVDPRIARSNPEAYALQAQRVTDTILNRVASPYFPNTVAAVLNQDRQFSAIAGPAGRPGEHYGTVENIPASRADETLRNILDTYLDQRVAGALPSSVGGSLNYANPRAADASNLDWINKLNFAVDDAGPFSHRYGVAQGYRPFEATFVNPALDAANALAGGGFMTASDRARAAGRNKASEEKIVRPSSSPINDNWTTPSFGSRDTVQQRAAGVQAAAKMAPVQREPVTQAWTQPQMGASDRARMAQAAARSPGAKAATPSKVSVSNNYDGSSSSDSSSSSSSSYTGSNTGTTGSRTATTSTSSSSKSATSSSSKSSSSSSKSATNASKPATSASSYTGASDKVRGNSSSSSSAKSSSSSSGRMNAGMY